MAVAMKQIDFATNNTENSGKILRERPEIANNVKIIWKSPLIPKDPYVWRKDLPQELKSKIKAFFLSYGRLASDNDELKRQLAVLKGVSDGLAPFLDSSNRQLLPIREIDYAKEMQKIKADANLKENDKKTKIAKIQEKLNALKKHNEYLQQF
jgi:phosphonate transport system substrate-binding protein